MNELDVEKVAQLRAWIHRQITSGIPLSKIDAGLKATGYPADVTTENVMKMSGQDSARSLAMGLTLNQLPKVAGAIGAIKGKGYAASRDRFLNQDAESNAANPGTNLATRAVGGLVPGVLASMVPGAAPVEGAHAINALKMALGAGAQGAIAGEGASTADTPGGVLKDAATSGGISALLGGLGGAAASKFASKTGDMALPGQGGNRSVLKEGGALMPNSPAGEVRAAAARQEQLAPGTVVGADLSPGLQKMTSGVGASRAVAMKATAEAEARHYALNQARKTVGQQYDILKGQMAPVDPDLLVAILNTGKKGIIPKGATEIDMSKIHDLRSALLKKASVVGDNDPSAAYELRQQAKPLTEWIQKQWPAIKGIDGEYAFIADRLDKAAETMKYIKNSAMNYGVQRAYGQEPSSIGGSLPGPLIPGGPAGTTMRVAGKILSPSAQRAARAQSVYDQFLTPINRSPKLLDNLIGMHEALQQPVDHSLLNTGVAALFQGAVPATTAGVMSQQ